LSAQEIVNWVTTADGCVYTADATKQFRRVGVVGVYWALLTHCVELVEHPDCFVDCEIFACRTENGVDGLQYTRSWLTRSADCIKTSQLVSELAAETEASASFAAPASGAAANSVLNAAFLELLDWDDSRVFPEVR